MTCGKRRARCVAGAARQKEEQIGGGCSAAAVAACTWCGARGTCGGNLARCSRGGPARWSCVNMPSSRRSGWMLSSAKASRVLPALCCTGSGGGKLNTLEPEGLEKRLIFWRSLTGAGSTPWWWWWCRLLVLNEKKCWKGPFRQPNVHVSDLRHLSSAER